MPWLVGGAGLMHWPEDGSLGEPEPYHEVSIPMGVEYLSDADVLRKSPGMQFGVQPDGSENFMRAEFEVSRKFWYLKRPRKTLPSCIAGGVCDRLKRLVEELEPGKHRFIPRDLRQPDKVTAWPEPYWYWQMDNFIDAIVPCIGDGDPRRSKGFYWNAEKGWLGAEDGAAYSSHSPTSQKVPVLNRTAIENQHVWRDKGVFGYYRDGYKFYSDTIVARMKEQGLHRPFNFGPIAVSDLPATRDRIVKGE